MNGTARRSVMAALTLVCVGSAADAQDCAPTPLLGRRVAAGAQVVHSDAGETGMGALLAARLAGPVRLQGDYRATRLDDVQNFAQEGRVGLALGASLAGFDLCPVAGVGYRRLSTTTSTTTGHVGTTEMRVGASLGRPFAVASATQLTPFVEPTFVRRSVSWESVDSWRVERQSDEQETQLWFGVSLAVSRAAVIARYLPSRGAFPQQFGVAVVTAFGRR